MAVFPAAATAAIPTDELPAVTSVTFIFFPELFTASPSSTYTPKPLVIEDDDEPTLIVPSFVNLEALVTNAPTLSLPASTVRVLAFFKSIPPSAYRASALSPLVTSISVS